MNIQIHKVYRKRDLTLKTLGYPNNRHTHITCIYPRSTLTVAPMGVKFGTEVGTEGRPLLHAKFHPHRRNVSSLRGEKPQNRPLSTLNTGCLRFAHCCW